jgi:hypothetical protein
VFVEFVESFEWHIACWVRKTICNDKQVDHCAAIQNLKCRIVRAKKFLLTILLGFAVSSTVLNLAVPMTGTQQNPEEPKPEKPSGE